MGKYRCPKCSSWNTEEHYPSKKPGTKVATTAAGALIGSFIVPGIGTAVGATLGSWLGNATETRWQNEYKCKGCGNIFIPR